MKLRHRLLLMMLAVFLLLTGAGTGVIIRQSFLSAVQTETDRALTESAIIAAFIHQRVEKLELQPLRDEMAAQDSFYSAQGVRLTMLYGGRTLYGEETSEPDLLPTGNTRRYLQRDRRLFIAQRLSDTLTLLYERSLHGLYENRDRLLSLALLLCAAGSALILTSVLVITRVIMRPIDRLQKAAEKVAAGDYTVSLPTRGQVETALLARQFEKMALAVKTREAELIEQAERKQLFIDSLAHEMRTPLTAVMGYARYLQSVDAGEAERQKALAYIVTEAKRLKGLDETLMTLTRLNRDGADLCPVDIKAIIGESASRARPMYEEKGVFLNVSARAGVWQADESLLLLIAGNLLQNALTASAPGATVTLLGEPGALSVSDTGLGMTPEQLDRACDAFYKADKARTRKAGGAGLGLTLVRQAAGLMGARLTLASRPGQGTTASLIFDNSVTTV